MCELSDIGNTPTLKQHFDDDLTISDEENDDGVEKILLSCCVGSEVDEETRDLISENENDPPNQSARDVEPLCFQAKNKGGLTRPVPEIFPFARRVLEMIREDMGQQILTKESLKNTYERVTGNSELFQIWSELANRLTPGISFAAVEASHLLVLRKIIHSRGAEYLQKYVTSSQESSTSKGTIRTYLKAYVVAHST
jgi:hypothetical protein